MVNSNVALCNSAIVLLLFNSILNTSTDCIDLLYPWIKLVKELCCDVGCIPRYSNHGAHPYKTQNTKHRLLQAGGTFCQSKQRPHLQATIR